MSKEWTIILNPRAGGGRAKAIWERVATSLDEAGLKYTIMQTSRRNHAIYLTHEAIKTGSSRILAVGGDGTASEVANGILTYPHINPLDILMAQIPIGTGNDWGRTVGIPSDYRRAIEALRLENTFVQDAGIMRYTGKEGQEERFFINIAGLGFDAYVGDKVNERRASGSKVNYLGMLLKCMFSYKARKTTFTVDGKEFTDTVFSAAVANCRFNGGGMMQAPNASADDGILDLTVIGDLTKLEVIRNVKKLYNGAFIHHPKVQTHTGTHIRISGPPDLLFECDGEVLGSGTAEFSIRPKTLRVVVE